MFVEYFIQYLAHNIGENNLGDNLVMITQLFPILLVMITKLFPILLVTITQLVGDNQMVIFNSASTELDSTDVKIHRC